MGQPATLTEVWSSHGPGSSAEYPTGQPAPGAIHIDRANGRVEAYTGGSWRSGDLNASTTQVFRSRVVARDTDAEGTTNLFVSPIAGVVTAVTYTTDSAITGADTDSRTVTLINLGAAGSGTAEAAELAFVTGVDSAAGVPEAITVTSTAADKAVVAGDVLQWSSTAPGTGLADPGGLVTVTITRS